MNFFIYFQRYYFYISSSNIILKESSLILNIYAITYEDHVKSGRLMDKRGSFQKLLKKIRAGHIDLVLVKSLSMFARNTVGSFKVIQETRKLGV